MNVLLIYPRYPATFWSFKYALSFINKKAANPPLGLLTVSSLLPACWTKKLVDLNVTSLKDEDIIWADHVFISGMSVQRESAMQVADRVKTFGKSIVAGGPLFINDHDIFDKVDCFVLDEGEETIPLFLSGLEKGLLKRMYRSPVKPDLSKSPVPDWSLVNTEEYATMCMQISRGCPYRCDFCDIVILNGRKPRYKSVGQVTAELEAIYNIGWRGGIFIVDDNFIGNYARAKEILQGIIKWMDNKKMPFTFSTEAPITLADNEELLDLMKRANFDTVFVGIETPDENGLQSCGKVQNTNKNLVEKVRILQRNGLEVQGGFIIGFDTDTTDIFDNMIKFIQDSGIVTAMVGLLHALPGTKLYKKLQAEKRLTTLASGNNTDFVLNFMPKMNMDTLIEGYKRVQNTLFNPKVYYERVRIYMKEYKNTSVSTRMPLSVQVKALVRSIIRMGLIEKGKLYFWQFLLWTVFRKPRYVPIAITLSIYGYHFRKVLMNQ